MEVGDRVLIIDTFAYSGNYKYSTGCIVSVHNEGSKIKFDIPKNRNTALYFKKSGFVLIKDLDYLKRLIYDISEEVV